MAPQSHSAVELSATEGLSSPLVGGRYYALGQGLAREQQHSAALEAQLEERTREIEQLRTDVEQLRNRETELRASLDRALATAGEAPAAAGGTAVFGARQKHGKPAGPASEPEGVPRDSVPRDGGPRDGGPGTGEAGADSAAAERAAQAAVVASLRTQLSHEEERRQSAETALARLKEETSVPAFGPTGDAAGLAATKQEVVDLRKALADERTARARMADEFRALQQRAAEDATPVQEPSTDSTELRVRLQSLQAEKDALVEGFNRSLGESQKRAWELEQQLATARVAAAALPPNAGDGNVSAIREENTALRQRLDEEHRRTEELAAKLKLATRVTDLIFKMQAQQAQAAPASMR